MTIESYVNKAIDTLLKKIRRMDTTSRKRMIWIASGSIIIIIAFYYLMSFETKVRNVTWTRVQNSTFAVDITESGEVRAVNSYNIQSPMEWRMELQITDMVKEGTLVQEGDFLVQFDATTLEEELDTSKDQLKAQEAELLSVETKQKSQLSQFESDLKMAEYSREASKLQLELLKFESEVRKEDARLAYMKALISFDETETKIKAQKIIDEAEMGRVQQTLRYRRNNVNDIKKRIDQLTLKAPTYGMVVYNEIGGWRGTPKHKVAIGETVWPRMTVIQIPDLSEMESVIRVNEIDASKILVGQDVNLILDAFEDRTFNGTVVSVAPLADKADSEEESHIKDLEVVIRIDESHQILKPGMSAKTRIILEEIPDARYVLNGAVFEQNGETVIFPRSTYPQPVTVKLGKRNDLSVIIEADKDYDEIALTPPVSDAYKLGWFAEMEQRSSEKAELLGHLNKMDENGIVEIIEKKVSKAPKKIPEQFKIFADMLEKAGHPLSEEQIEKLASLQPGPGSQGGMSDLLTEEQQNALKNLRGSSGGRPGQSTSRVQRSGGAGTARQ